MDPKPLLCFLVDDDPDDHELFSLALQEIDGHVLCEYASDGVHAMERIINDPSFLPSCLFIDLNMPRKDGIEFLRDLRQIERLRNIPVYMYSIGFTDQGISAIKSLGVSGFIEKPSDCGLLKERLREVINQLKDPPGSHN